MKQSAHRFTCVRRFLRRLVNRGPESRPEAEFLGYEAYPSAPDNRSHENRPTILPSPLKRVA